MRSQIVQKRAWKIRETSDGHYCIISKLNGYCFDLETPSDNKEIADGKNISQYIYNGATNQKWNFLPVLPTGDVTDNGKIDLLDLIMLKRWIHGSGELGNTFNADLNSDNIIDIYDLALLKRLLLQ